MSREIEEFESKIRQIEAETTSMEKSSVMRNVKLHFLQIIKQI